MGYDNVSSPEVTYGLNVNDLPSGVKVIEFKDGRATVTLDITSVDKLNGDWAYLAGITSGTLLIETAAFGK